MMKNIVTLMKQMIQRFSFIDIDDGNDETEMHQNNNDNNIQ